MATESEVLSPSDAPVTTARESDQRRRAAGRDREDAIIGRSVTINRPRDEVYAYWRNFSNLAEVMENIVRVDVVDERRSHWVVKAAGDGTVEWDSIITAEEPGHMVAWQSVEGADVSSSGRVEFLDAAPGRGTIVRATIAYDPPAGVIGEWIATLFQREPAIQARRDLRRLKQLLETGEISSSAGPSGRESEAPTEQAL
jgi:uncharacterized membrane protein